MRTRFVPVGVVLWLCISAISYSPQLAMNTIGTVFALMGIGLLMMVLPAQSSLMFHRENTTVAHENTPYTPLHALIFGMGMIALLVVAAGGAPQHHTLALSPMRMELQMALFVGGIIGVCVGASGLRFRAVRLPRFDLVLIAITALGWGLRVINLEHAVHLFVDEQHFSNAVVHLRGDPHTPLFTPMNLIASFPWFYSVLQTGAVSLFGATLSGVRIVSVIFGTLTIPAVYLLGRRLYDRKLGLLAALILATFPPHIHFSRLALNNIADPLFGTLALALIARGTKGGTRTDFVLAGVCLGLTQIFYEGGRLLFPALVGFWLVVALIRRKIILKQVMLSFGVFLLVTLPLILTLLEWESSYIPRLEGQMALSQASDESFVEKSAFALAHFISRPDTSNFYYAGGTALLLPVMLPAFFAGLATIMRFRHGWILPVILLLTIAGNSLIEFPDWSVRFVVAFPALALIMAVGWRTLWQILQTGAHSPNTTPSFLEFIGMKRVRGSVWILLVLIAFIPPIHYFFAHLPLYNQQIRPTFDHQDVGFRVREMPENTRIYLLTGAQVFMPHFQGMSRYWERPLDVQLEVDGQTTFSLEEYQREVPLAIFVAPGDVRAISDLDRLFDLPEPRYSPFNVPRDKQYLLYFLEVK